MNRAKAIGVTGLLLLGLASSVAAQQPVKPDLSNEIVGAERSRF
jgi:hypothetical protein